MFKVLLDDRIRIHLVSHPLHQLIHDPVEVALKLLIVSIDPLTVLNRDLDLLP